MFRDVPCSGFYRRPNNYLYLLSVVKHSNNNNNNNNNNKNSELYLKGSTRQLLMACSKISLERINWFYSKYRREYQSMLSTDHSSGKRCIILRFTALKMCGDHGLGNERYYTPSVCVV